MRRYLQVLAEGLEHSRKFLLLSKRKDLEIRLDLKDENTQCIGYPVEGEDKRYLCVIMPMRI